MSEQGLPQLDGKWCEETKHLRTDGHDDHERTRAVLHCRERQLREALAKLAQLESQPSRGAGENASSAEEVRERTIRECLEVLSGQRLEWLGYEGRAPKGLGQAFDDVRNAILALLSQPESASEPEARKGQ